MNFVPKSLLEITERPGDYWRDGILFCGKCNTPRTALMGANTGELAGRLVPTTCKCNGERESAAALEKHRERVEQLRSKCLPLADMRAATFDNADNCKAVQIARKYVDKWESMQAENIGLLFCGNTGGGKSYAALCIVNALIDHEIDARYITAPEAIAVLKEAGEARRELERQVARSPLLVLDDLGAEGGNEYAQSLVCQIVDARDRAGKPLIVTTNLPIANFQGKADQMRARTCDRIAKLCVPISVVGESRRQKQAAQKLQTAREMLEI